MREIKFRTWDKTNKVMIDENTSTKELIKMQMSLNLNNPMRLFYFEDEWYPVMEATILFDALSTLKQDYEDKIEIMQYTNIKDKNGKEIYEGDILKVDNYIMYGEGSKEYQEVGFEYGSFMTARYGGKAFNTYLWIIVSDGCEVVGNIYENPELLEVNENGN